MRRGRNQIVARPGGGPGFHAVSVEIRAPQQTVAVRLTDFVEGELFFFMDRILFRHVMDHRFGEQRHIAGGTKLTWRIQTVHGHKGGVGQAHFLRIAVHQADKRVLAARHVVGDRDAGVVAGLNDNALVKIFDRHLHSWLKEHHR